ncbi:MAG: murein biosynthesis integral membrane protein MurJ [Acidobacteria bacterium]|jgi:putative peptidoglycan lipid II flippase|nr:MAG: murein biosynthesis integral membrane protein MurJ [Acidobacteriota bacterium]GIU81709.1 MAG: putative lipid II flippase MurJ [Pyrinomonadaceae bacterium]
MNQTTGISQSAESEKKPMTKQTSVARSAGVVSIAVMFSRIMGLIREQVFAYYFGAGFLYDAYQVAFRIPNVLRDLFAEGALSAAFVKVFTDYQINKSEKEAWRLASLVMNALAVVLSIITIIGIIFSEQIVNLIADGFSPEKAWLATVMTQIMFPFILLVALAAVAMGVLNTKGIFGIPASASTVFNIVSILFGLGFAYWLSGGSWERSFDKETVPSMNAQWAIIGMAIGTLIGGAAQFLMQVPSLLKVGFRFSPILSFTDEGVRQVMKLMTPAILGTSAVQINVMVNTFFVSGIEGGISWLQYAFRLMQFPIGVFGVAVGTASVPVLSRMASQNKLVEFRNTLSDSLTLVFLMTVPSACGLIVLGEPIIRLLYSHGGAFKETDVPMTAYALAGYAIGLTGYAAIKVLSPAFYALNDAKTPMLIAVLSILVNALASYFFRNWLSHFHVSAEHPHGLAHVGVALATSSVALVNFFALAAIMRRRIKGLNGRKIASAFFKIAIASAIMSISTWLLFSWLHSQLKASSLIAKAIECLIPVAFGVIVFFLSAKLLKVEEVNKIYRAFAKKLGFTQ